MNIDPLWATGAAAFATLLTYLNVRRQERRKDTTEPVTAMATAAQSIAGAVDDMIAPLRAEMNTLRAEVAAANVNNLRLSDALTLRSESERQLRDEVTALRLEVAMLRTLLYNNGIPAPPSAVRS